MHVAKWYQILPCIFNNSIKHQLFVYTQLNDQTFLFLTIQFGMSFVCTQFKCQTVQFNPYTGPNQVVLPQVRADQRTMAMKGYSTFPKAPALLEPHHQMIRHIQATHWRVLTPLQRCSQWIQQSQPTGQPDKFWNWW